MAYSSRKEGCSPRDPQLFSKMHGLGNDFIVVPLPPIAKKDLVCFDPNELNTAKVNCNKRSRDVEEEEEAGVSNNSPTAGNESDDPSPSPVAPTHAEGKYHPMLESFMKNNGRRIRCLSSRKRGIGCDQFIVYSGALLNDANAVHQQFDNGQSQSDATPRPPDHKKGSNLADTADANIPAVFMWIFNGATGDEVGMCGNAVRCVVKHFILEYERCLDHWGLGEKKTIYRMTATNGGAAEIVAQRPTRVPRLFFSDTYFKKVVQRIINCDITDFRAFSEEGCAMLGMASSAPASPFSGTNESDNVTTSTSCAADKHERAEIPNLYYMYAGPLASYKVSVLVPKADRHLSCVMEIDPMKASDVLKKELAHIYMTSAGRQTSTNSASQSSAGQPETLANQSEAAAAAGITPTDGLIQQHIFCEFVTPSCVERALMPFQQHTVTYSPSSGFGPSGCGGNAKSESRALTRELAERAMHEAIARPLLERLSANAAAAVAAAAASTIEGEDVEDDATLNLAAASPIVRVNMGPVKKGMLQKLYFPHHSHYQPSLGHLLKESDSSLPFPPNLSDIFGGNSVYFLQFLVQRMKLIEKLANSKIDEDCGNEENTHDDGSKGNGGQKELSVRNMLRNLFFRDQVFIGRVRELCSRFGVSGGNSSSSSTITTNTLLQESFGKLVASVRGKIEDEILFATPTTPLSALQTVVSAGSSTCAAGSDGGMTDATAESRVPLISICDVGNPHCVFLFNQQVFARDLLAANDLFVSVVGIIVERGLPEFFPQGVNVEFAYRMEEYPVRPTVPPSVVRMRVWERGEGITEACGSGACAVGVASHVLSLPVMGKEKETRLATGTCKRCFEFRTRVVLDGGVLLIDTIQEGGDSSICGLTIASIVMAGDATLVASGSLAF